MPKNRSVARSAFRNPQETRTPNRLAPTPDSGVSPRAGAPGIGHGVVVLAATPASALFADLPISPTSPITRAPEVPPLPVFEVRAVEIPPVESLSPKVPVVPAAWAPFRIDFGLVFGEDGRPVAPGGSYGEGGRWSYTPAPVPASKRKRGSGSRTGGGSPKRARTELTPSDEDVTMSSSSETDSDSDSSSGDDSDSDDEPAPHPATTSDLAARRPSVEVSSAWLALSTPWPCAPSSAPLTPAIPAAPVTPALTSDLNSSLLPEILPTWSKGSTRSLAVSVFAQQISIGGDVLDAEDDGIRWRVSARRKRPASAMDSTPAAPDVALQTLYRVQPILADALCRMREGDGSNLEGSSLKGPLTVQQFYDIQDSDRPYQKYAKLGLRKKKRSAEPTLDPLPTPPILFTHSSASIQASPAILRFWDKLRLGPHAGPKNCIWFCIAPAGNAIAGEVAAWAREVAVAWEAAGFGSCVAGDAGGSDGGIVQVPLEPPLEGESADALRLRSYMMAMDRLAVQIGMNLLIPSASLSSPPHIVIHILNPFPLRPNATFDLSYLYARLLERAWASSPLKSSEPQDSFRARLVPNIVPIDAVLSPDAFRGRPVQGVGAVCWSVYSRAKERLVRDGPSPAVATIHAPPYVLARPTPARAPHFSANRRLASAMLVMEPERIIHVAYAPAGEMVDVMWIEAPVGAGPDAGRSDVLSTIWKRTKEICGEGGMLWRVVIGRLGGIEREEAEDWETILTPYIQATSLNAPAQEDASSTSSPLPTAPNTPRLAAASLTSTAGSTTPSTPDSSVSLQLRLSRPIHVHPAPPIISSIASVSLVSLEPRAEMQFFAPRPAASASSSSSAGASTQATGATTELIEDGPVSYAFVVNNHRVPVQRAIAPLATAWIVDVPRSASIPPTAPSTASHPASASTTVTTPHPVPPTVSAPSRGPSPATTASEISLLWHFQNPWADPSASPFAAWHPTRSSLASVPLPNSNGPGATSTSTTPPAGAVQPHHAAIVRDVARQYHALRFIGRGPSSGGADTDIGGPILPWMFDCVGKGLDAVRCVPRAELPAGSDG
ncbi:hypothetical protein BDK51DRAFT_40084 [Blyttiomyces helicus]|uniref:Mediator of RNA polymerase II transcription subunit 13 n=1 Tax=Blyttiomyces helicus TaxID=388810 RepID=A0A4P9WS98_9FUNG|nr:hypothetical protein BDK51DRAFT_40084 [Blyttiomyces helicus]|eukprot:RKO93866.1 hypothetical protein BDK51DRAFT_40084 [Blyttiomyces helicus]